MIDRTKTRHERILEAQKGPKPEPVGDIFTAICQAAETLRARRDGRQPRHLYGAPPLSTDLK